MKKTLSSETERILQAIQECDDFEETSSMYNGCYNHEVVIETFFVQYTQQNKSAQSNSKTSKVLKKRKFKNSNDESSLVTKMITNYFNTENVNKINNCSFQDEASVLVEVDKSNVSSNCSIVQGGEPSVNVHCPFSSIINDSNAYSNDHIIAKVGNDLLTIGELKRFLPQQLISSENIDIFFKIMCNQDLMDSLLNLSFKSSHFFNCMFFSLVFKYTYVF